MTQEKKQEQLHQDYIIMLKAYQVCSEMFTSLFKSHSDYINGNPAKGINKDEQFEQNCLSLASYVLNMSISTMQIGHRTYDTYIHEQAEALGYDKDAVEDSAIFKYAMLLRELFEGKEGSLRFLGIDKVYNVLPTSPHIKSLLTHQFEELSQTFRFSYEHKLVAPGNVGDFIQNKLKEVIKHDEFFDKYL